LKGFRWQPLFKQNVLPSFATRPPNAHAKGRIEMRMMQRRQKTTMHLLRGKSMSIQRRMIDMRISPIAQQMAVAFYEKTYIHIGLLMMKLVKCCHKR
jgi:hypothetical protein